MVLLPFLLLVLSANTTLGATWPIKFQLSWITETGRSPDQSSLLRPIELQEWSVTVDEQHGRLCAIRSTGGREQFLLSKKLPEVSVIDPQLGIIIPFYLADSNFFRLPIPYLGALEMFTRSPQSSDQVIEGGPESWRRIRFRRASAMPLGPVPANMDIVEHSGNRSGFTRWRLVSFSEMSEVVDQALIRCEARAHATAGLTETLTATLFRSGRSPTLLTQQSLKQVKGRVWHPSDHLTIESSASLQSTYREPTAGASPPSRPMLQRVWSLISAADGPRCPHYPTCSEYCVLATRKHGILKGLWMTAERLLEESFDFESSGSYRLVYHLGRWRVFDPVN